MTHTKQNVKDKPTYLPFFFRLFSMTRLCDDDERKKVFLLVKKNFTHLKKYIKYSRYKTESKRDYNERILQYKTISRQITLNLLLCYTDDTSVQMSKHKPYLQSRNHPFPKTPYLDIMDAYLKSDLMYLIKRGHNWVINGIPDKEAGAYRPSQIFIQHIKEIWRDTMPTFTPTESYPTDWSCVYISNKDGERVPYPKEKLISFVRSLNRKNKTPSVTKLLQYSSIIPTYEVLDKLNKMMSSTVITFDFSGKAITELTPTQIESVAELARERRIISLFDLPDKMVHKINSVLYGLEFYSLKVREKEMDKIIKRRRGIYEEKGIEALNLLRVSMKERKKIKKNLLNEIRNEDRNEIRNGVRNETREEGRGTPGKTPLSTGKATPSGEQCTQPRQESSTREAKEALYTPLSGPTSTYLSEIIRKYPMSSLGEIGYENAQKQMTEIKNLWRKYNYFVPTFYVPPTRLVRIFNETVLKNGRFYRATVQSLPGELRPYLRFNGKQICECDFSTIHPSILYNIENIQPPENIYVYGKDEPLKRKEAKDSLLILINEDNETGAIGAIRQKFIKDYGYRGGDPRLKNEYILGLLNVIKEHNSPISKYFCTGKGIELMRIDSDIALQVLGHFVKKDVLVIPVHDSFICPVEYKDEMVAIMKQTFKNVVGTLWEIPVEVTIL